MMDKKTKIMEHFSGMVGTFITNLNTPKNEVEEIKEDDLLEIEISLSQELSELWETGTLGNKSLVLDKLQKMPSPKIAAVLEDIEELGDIKMALDIAKFLIIRIA